MSKTQNSEAKCKNYIHNGLCELSFLTLQETQAVCLKTTKVTPTPATAHTHQTFTPPTHLQGHQYLMRALCLLGATAVLYLSQLRPAWPAPSHNTPTQQANPRSLARSSLNSHPLAKYPTRLPITFTSQQTAKSYNGYRFSFPLHSSPGFDTGKVEMKEASARFGFSFLLQRV